MTDIAFSSARQLATMIRKGRIGAEELLDHYLARVRASNPALNAIIATRIPAARKQARAADNMRGKRGFTPGPLFGVPITVKESFDVKGMPTTWGLTRLARHKARQDALVVSRLSDAGAIVFGKTNVPVNLADWQSFNPVYGTTNNPWRLQATPGGSSGGSAAALAAGLTGLEYGSDIGASIRNPAHYCGVFGHKPTFGIVASNGQTLDDKVARSDMAVVGPLARSVADLRLALQLTAGPDPVDGAGWQLQLRRPAFHDPAELRVAVMTTTPTADVDMSVQQPILELARELRRLGAKVSLRARPAIDFAQLHQTYFRILRFTTAGATDPAQQARFEHEAARLDPQRTDYEAELIRGNTMAPREFHALNEIRHQMRMAWAAFFSQWDVLLCPPAATAAFDQNEQGERYERMVMVNGEPQPGTTQMFWAGIASLCYLPATVAPLTTTAQGLPTGVQIVGPQYGDLTTLAVAALIEKHGRRFTPPPGYA